MSASVRAVALCGMFLVGGSVALVVRDIGQYGRPPAASPAEAKASSSAASSAELDALRAELAVLRSQVRSLRPSTETPSEVPRPEVDRAERAEQEATRAIVTSAAYREQRSLALRDRLDRDVHQLDAAWSKEYERQLSAVLELPALEHGVVTEMQCGRAVCRLTASHANLEAAERFTTMLALLAPQTGGSWAQPSVTGDGATSVVYLARPETGRSFHAALAEEEQKTFESLKGDQARSERTL